MRSISLKIGLLLVLFPAALAFAAGEQQDGDSYLPPASLRAAPNTAPAASAKQATVEPRRYARPVHRRHEARYHSYRRYAGPVFYFLPF